LISPLHLQPARLYQQTDVNNGKIWKIKNIEMAGDKSLRPCRRLLALLSWYCLVANLMKKLELYLFILSIGLCTFVQSEKTIDYTMTTRQLVWSIATLVLFVSIAIRLIKRPADVDLSVVKMLIFPVSVCFFLVSAVTLLWTHNIGEGFYEVLKIFLTIVYLFVAVIVLKDKETFMKAMVIFGLALAIYGIVNIIQENNLGLVRGPMANKNPFSSALFLFLPFCLYGILKGRVLSILTAVLLLCVIFTLRTRAVLLAVFIAAIVATFSNKKAFYVTIFCIVVIGAVLVFFVGADVYSTESLRNGRYDMWSQTLNMTIDHPFGVGIGSWEIYISKYIKNMNDFMISHVNQKEYFTRPHNGDLLVLAETSIIGLLLYLGIFVTALYYTFKSRSIYLYSFIIGYMAIEFFSFPRERPFHSIAITVLMALAVLEYHRPVILKLPLRLRKPLFAYQHKMALAFAGIFVIGLLSVTIYDFAYRHKVELSLHRMYKAVAREDWDAVLDESDNYSILSDITPTSAPIAYYMAIANYRTGKKEKSFELFKEAERVNPYHVYVLMNLGHAYDKHGEFTKSVEIYERVVSLYPKFERARKSLRHTQNVQIINAMYFMNLFMKG